MTALIFDGVFDRHPNLKFGVIELGASWLPSWLRFMDSGFEAFRKGEARLQALSMKPSELAERHYESRRIAMSQPVGSFGVSPDMLLFSSDFPHVEGGLTRSNALRTTWKALATRLWVAFTETISLI